MKIFGEKLRELRLEVGKSQLQIVDEIRVLYGNEIRMSQTTLSSLEQRETAPREDVLNVLCKYYNVPKTYFYSDESSNVADISTYIDALRQFTPENEQRFAHSMKLRSDDDEIQSTLDNMEDYRENDEYLDVDDIDF